MGPQLRPSSTGQGQGIDDGVAGHRSAQPGQLSAEEPGVERRVMGQERRAIGIAQERQELGQDELRRLGQGQLGVGDPVDRSGPAPEGRSGLTNRSNSSMTWPEASNFTAPISTIRSDSAESPVVSRSNATYRGSVSSAIVKSDLRLSRGRSIGPTSRILNYGAIARSGIARRLDRNESRTDNRSVEQTRHERSTARRIAMAAASPRRRSRLRASRPGPAGAASPCPPLEASQSFRSILGGRRTGRRRPQRASSEGRALRAGHQPDLEAAAMEHARDMADRHKMAHRGGDGSSPFDRMKRQGYRFRTAAENVAYGFEDVDSVMTGWMKSPGHRRNILGNFSEIGVGRAIARDGASYWCVTFGTPSGG